MPRAKSRAAWNADRSAVLAGAEGVRKSRLQRLVAVNRLSVEGQHRCASRPHEPRQPLHAAVARDDAELDLRLADPGVLSDHPEVRAHRQLVPASEGESIDEAHDGDGQVLQPGIDAEDAGCNGCDLLRGPADEAGDVRARHERPPGPAQHDRLHVPPREGSVLLDFADHRVQPG